MSRDHFSILGLTPGRYEPAEIARRFVAARARLLAALNDPRRHPESQRRLDELHMAYAALRDPARQAAILRARRVADEPLVRMRRLIAASLEDGMLRYSRRQDIIAEGGRLGYNDFQVQLLIAQVQFGSEELLPVGRRGRPRSSPRPSQVGARFAAVGVLALAFFLAMVRWLGA